MNSFWRNPFSVVVPGIGIAVLLTMATILPAGQRTISPLENISSLPFPTAARRSLAPSGPAQGAITITEALAHTDIRLQEPVAAKKIVLQITFIPYESKNLAVGIRENSFWYSYTPVPFFEAGMTNLSSQEVHHATVEIPLTDKLADRNQTLDMLFFTNTPVDPGSIGTADHTYWQLVDLQVTTAYGLPSVNEWKDFIRSLLHRERVV
ncbi:MAG: hypothetical protein HYZ63_00265 [Candidatus Andersenbacteria bacterium]|nr:hypothetical protein [Candidatus Andersenbacteria bacterium]